MNSEDLLSHFSRISEAPDAVPRLRRFILDLAVRGKLVEQDPKDEPASELLKRIEQAKAKLRAAAGPKKEKTVPIITGEEPAFSIPTNWAWSQLAKIGFINPRNNADDASRVAFIPMPLISAGYGVAHGQELKSWGDIRTGYTHFADGDVGLAKITPCFENGKSAVFRGLTGGIGAGTTELHIVRPLVISPDYIVIFLKSPTFIESGIPRMTGTAGQKRVPIDYFGYSPFPLPPVAEQHRIVAKVDELMALCDKLEAAQAERENRRDRLVSASLARLNNGADAQEFRDHARFHLRHLPRLTTRPAHIQQLRQSILNLAVRGKLVPQDPGDEPASELIEKIFEKKKNLFGSKRARTPKIPELLPEKEIPFNVPRSWVWVRLGDVYDVRDGTHDTPRYVDTGYPLVTSKNLSTGRLSFENVKFISKRDHVQISRRSAVEREDILLAMIGSIGNPVIVDTERAFSIKNVALFKYYDRKLSCPGYLCVFLKHAAGVMRGLAAGGLQPFVSLGFLRKYPIALPPLAEQHRIFLQVEELMRICGQLENHMTTTQTERRRLLEAVLGEALTM